MRVVRKPSSRVLKEKVPPLPDWVKTRCQFLYDQGYIIKRGQAFRLHRRNKYQNYDIVDVWEGKAQYGKRIIRRIWAIKRLTISEMYKRGVLYTGKTEEDGAGV